MIQSVVTVVERGKCRRESVCTFMQSDVNLPDVFESDQRKIPNVKAPVSPRSVNYLVPQLAELVLKLRYRFPRVEFAYGFQGL